MSGGHGGKRRGAGRPKGSISTESKDIREMVVGALCAVGGQDYLARQAEQNPVAFMALVGRVLPLQVTGENGGALLVDFRWADAPSTSAVVTDAAPAVIEDAEVVWSDSEC